MKYLTTVLIYALIIFGMVRTFNRISLWLGAAIGLAAIFIATKQIENKIK